jgi:predicted GTPase
MLPDPAPFPPGGKEIEGEALVTAQTSPMRTGSGLRSLTADQREGDESAFELHANGGIPAWRGRIRRSFSRYNELANGVLQALSLEMPTIDLDSLRAAPLPQRRPVTPTPSRRPEGS